MHSRHEARWTLAVLILGLALVAGACAPAAAPEATPAAPAEEPTATAEAAPTEAAATEAPAEEGLIFGMVLVGPSNDRGWSQAHFEAGQYVEENVPDAEMVWIDKLNPADRPGTTLESVVEDMVSNGARLIFTTSDDFKDPTHEVAKKYPEVAFEHISGDGGLTGNAPSNVGNIMGQMEYGKMIAGCAAALNTQTGKIAYLGPLINDETRRLASAAYLGARHCWENNRGEDVANLTFTVTWIGFWIHIPGVTLDPTQVANDFFDSGHDIVISGIDTTEGLVVTGQRAARGEEVLSIPYDFEGACEEAPDVCLGVPYFNWGPAYLKAANEVVSGAWEQDWEWNPPDWSDLNDQDTTAVGWVDGPALGEEARSQLQEFIGGLADGSIVLYRGPLNFQDGSVFLEEGEEIRLGEDLERDKKIWYMPQLLADMTGASS